MSSRYRCPNWTCRSKKCIKLEATKINIYSFDKGLSLGLGGFLALGPLGLAIGSLYGFVGNKKIKMKCTKCGRVFEVKR